MVSNCSLCFPLTFDTKQHNKAPTNKAKASRMSKLSKKGPFFKNLCIFFFYYTPGKQCPELIINAMIVSMVSNCSLGFPLTFDTKQHNKAPTNNA